MNPFEMALGIVIVVMIASVLKARYRAKHGIIADEDGNETAIARQDDGRMQQEIKYLKERVAVLEKIATDERESRELENEIEKLRDK